METGPIIAYHRDNCLLLWTNHPVPTHFRPIAKGQLLPGWLEATCLPTIGLSPQPHKSMPKPPSQLYICCTCVYHINQVSPTRLKECATTCIWVPFVWTRRSGTKEWAPHSNSPFESHYGSTEATKAFKVPYKPYRVITT